MGYAAFSAPLNTGFNVHWEYADGKRLGGRLAGSQWVHYFRKDAIEQIPDPVMANSTRRLKPSGREVPSLSVTVDVTMRTHCPAKWAMVDMETGELWGHDGSHFRRLSQEEAHDVADVARAWK